MRTELPIDCQAKLGPQWLQEDTLLLEWCLVERHVKVTQRHHVSAYIRMHQESSRPSVLATQDCTHDEGPFLPVLLHVRQYIKTKHSGTVMFFSQTGYDQS